jgi:hypothetical protein
MSTVRGNAPLKATFVREVISDTWDETITVRVEGPGISYKLELELDPYQAVCLIRNLRRQLRHVRDQVTQRLAGNVTDAEGPL